MMLHPRASQRRPRRWAVVSLLAALLLACACRSATSQHAVSILTGSVASTVHAQPTPPPSLDLSATSVPQGSAFSVRLQATGIIAASARFNERDYPMVSSGDLWYAVIGVGQPIGSTDMLAARDYPVIISYQYSGSHEVQSTDLHLTVTSTTFPEDAIQVSEEKAQLLAPNLEAEEEEILHTAYSGFTPLQLWQGGFTMPLQGTITTPFGARRSYQGGPATGSHSGVDIGVPLGTPVGASAAGRVVWTGQLPERGNGVIIDHGIGVFSGYFHLSRIMAAQGQSVSQGDIVGLAGTTGLSTGPHLHWEIVVNGFNIDGLHWIQVTQPQPQASPTPGP